MTPKPLPVLSASQASNYKDCPRKWFLQSVRGHRTPPASSAQLGTRVHEILEAWLKTGQEPSVTEELTLSGKYGAATVHRPGQIARAGISLLPTPGSALVEGDFRITTPRAFWRGARDFVSSWDASRRHFLPPTEGLAKGYRLLLGDHKTASSRRWARTKEDLLEDIQGNLYAHSLLSVYDVPSIDARWVYYLTQGRPDAWPVDVTYEAPRVAEEIERLDTLALEMYAIRATDPNVTDVTPNRDACDKFGGCVFRGTDKCPLTTGPGSGSFWERLESLEQKSEEGTSSMTDKLSPSLSAILAKHHEAKGEAVPAALLPPAPPPPPPAPEAPKTWEPGDPLNQTQQGKLALRKSLMEVALAADFPPELEAVLSWGNAKKPYADVIADLEAAHALEREALAKIKAESLPPPPPPAPEAPAETPVGVPERGWINSPEGPAVAFKTPEELKAYQEAQDLALGLAPPAPVQEQALSIADGQTFEPYTDRDQAKKEAVRLGLVPADCSFRLPRLNEILGDFFLKGLSPEMTEQSKELSKKLSALPPPPKAPSFAPGAIASRVAPAASALGYLLFVGAFPVKGSFGRVVHFSEIATAALKAFQEKWNQPLPGFIDYKGNDYFAHEIEKELAKYGAGDVIYVDPRGREASAALSRLEQYAAAVVKGGF